MSCFLDSISTIISVFHKHTQEDGDSSTLTRSRMKELIQREFADALTKPHDPQTLEKILQFLEWGGDGEIDFNEFLLLVFRVAKCCYRYLPKAPYLLQRTKLPTKWRSHREREWECLDWRHPHQSYLEEPLEVDLRRCDLAEPEERGCGQRTRQEREVEYAERGREIQEDQEWEERDNPRRKGRMRERRVDLQQELELEVSERHSRQTREREQRGATTRDRVTREPEGDGRERDVVRYERTRETRVAAAEANVKVHREITELEPREDLRRRECFRECEEERRICPRREREEPSVERRVNRQQELELEVSERRSRQTREREHRGATTRDRVTWEPEGDGRRERDVVRYERTRDGRVAEAEVDVKVHREIRELEPREDLGRRECSSECEDEERRICPRREREEPSVERRVNRQQELELEVSERRSRQTREREHRGASTRDRVPQEPESYGRRERESARYERTRDTTVAAAEVDVKVHREIREVEPREDLRRECPSECEEEERRICSRREREEPIVERKVDLQRELELEVSERRSRQTQEREHRGATTNLRETRDR
ncbi:TRHY protein, partial [Formicarius rufipectus]|nr:TRHY protein [Formicarius rufipectus]